MSKTYRALTDAGKAAFGEDEFERDFTPAEEQDWLGSGVIEPVPQRYKVLSNNYHGYEQGDEFEGFFRIEIEDALIAGGHLERVEAKPGKKAAAKKATEKKSD